MILIIGWMIIMTHTVLKTDDINRTYFGHNSNTLNKNILTESEHNSNIIETWLNNYMPTDLEDNSNIIRAISNIVYSI